MTQKATKKEIHDLADKKGIPWDNDPKFKKWSKGLTGKSHLDDMSPEQLARLKKALQQKASVKEASVVSHTTGTLSQKRKDRKADV